MLSFIVFVLAAQIELQRIPLYAAAELVPDDLSIRTTLALSPIIHPGKTKDRLARTPDGLDSCNLNAW
ncbi:hypothetical protein ACN1C3_23020 [Pseudomonas sp. H11T01]|uniref:hypothetical protein n=1 Tax=Pseudomonas sp. H11T01 TaxID=3402749 RepID=UPI003AC2D7EA